MSYTITEKGAVTIPARIRRKYKLKTGSKVRFVETEHGALLLPVPSMEELRGILSKEMGYKMIREINTERMKDAARDVLLSRKASDDADSLRRSAKKGWDSTTEIRRWRERDYQR